jgi:HPt (histidine-containing phosphotransfer) domain-containing protein
MTTTTPALDLSLLLSRMQGNRALVRRLLELFLRDFGAAASDVRAALARDDARTVKLKVHTLKGVASNLSAAPLAAAARALEQAVLAGQLAEGEALLAALETTLAAAQAAARGALATLVLESAGEP